MGHELSVCLLRKQSFQVLPGTPATSNHVFSLSGAGWVGDSSPPAFKIAVDLELTVSVARPSEQQTWLLAAATVMLRIHPGTGEQVQRTLLRGLGSPAQYAHSKELVAGSLRLHQLGAREDGGLAALVAELGLDQPCVVLWPSTGRIRPQTL